MEDNVEKNMTVELSEEAEFSSKNNKLDQAGGGRTSYRGG